MHWIDSGSGLGTIVHIVNVFITSEHTLDIRPLHTCSRSPSFPPYCTAFYSRNLFKIFIIFFLLEIFTNKHIELCKMLNWTSLRLLFVQSYFLQCECECKSFCMWVYLNWLYQIYRTMRTNDAWKIIVRNLWNVFGLAFGLHNCPKKCLCYIHFGFHTC